MKQTPTTVLCLVAALTMWSAAVKCEGTGRIFVSNEMDNTISVIDGDNHEVITTIPVGERPRDMQWHNNKSQLLIATSGSDHIEILDVKTLEIVGVIEAGEDPELFDLDPSGKILVASNEDDNELTVSNPSTGEKIRTIENVGIEPEGVTFSNDGKVVFVTSEVTNTVIVVDPWSGNILDEALVGSRPRRGIFTPDGAEYWVTNELGGTVSILDTMTLEIIDEIFFEKPGMREGDINPVQLVMTASGETAYITLGRAMHVAVVDVKSRLVTDYILAGDRVWGAALTTDENFLMVTNGASDDISIIDTKKKVAVKAVAVGRTPHTIRIDD
jgi:PQQ-dependent catabolism-associated beta-propeller protein